MPAIDMTHIYGNRTYKGKWVAMKNYNSNPKVVAYGNTLKETLQKAKKKGIKDPVVTQIPKKLTYFVGISNP